MRFVDPLYQRCFEAGLYFNGLSVDAAACRVGPRGAALSEMICGDKILDIYYNHYYVPCLYSTADIRLISSLSNQFVSLI